MEKIIFIIEKIEKYRKCPALPIESVQISLIENEKWKITAAGAQALFPRQKNLLGEENIWRWDNLPA